MVGRCGEEAQLFGGEGEGGARIHERAGDGDTSSGQWSRIRDQDGDQRGALPAGGVCAPRLCLNSS